MTETYLSLVQAVRRLVPDVQWIDIDQGQIEALQRAEEGYEIDLPALPALIIGFPEDDWQQQAGNKSQVGVGQLVVTLLMQLPSTMSDSDPLLSMSIEALELAKEINEALLTLSNVKHRTRTRRFPAGYLYAVRQFYDEQISYIRPIKNIPKPVPKITGRIAFPIGQS